MNKPSRKTEWLVWGGLALLIGVIGVAFARSKLGTVSKPLPVIGLIPDFHLTDQNGKMVSQADLRGHIWVADLIYTQCSGPCTTMTHCMADLQSALPTDGSVRLVTLTADPEDDTPPVLKKYAERFGADLNRWSFLTGSNRQIRDLAVNDFKFVLIKRKPQDRKVPDDLFLHSTWFALVDQQGRVRGWTDQQGQLHAYFESTDPEALAQLRSSIDQLKRESPSK